MASRALKAFTAPRIAWGALAAFLVILGFACDGTTEIGHHLFLILGGVAVGYGAALQEGKYRMSKNAYEDLPTTRRCGACDLCCTSVGVYSIGKPPQTRCANLCGAPGKSCQIYGLRPTDCAEYVCLWRGSDSLLPLNMYPATAGFVVSLSGVEFPRLLTLTWDPGRPTAWDTPANRAAFFRIAARLNAAVVIGEAKHAHLVFTPIGVTLSREEYPLFFTDRTVGVPLACFLPERPTPQEFAARLFGISPV